MHSTYRPPDPSRWKGRTSDAREYIHEKVQMLSMDDGELPGPVSRTAALLGYATDEGVRRNRGRPGAAEGPGALRTALGKLPWPAVDLQLSDAGDLVGEASDLEGTQEYFADHIHRLSASGYFPLGIGGGHDMAYAHYCGLRRALPKTTRLAIVNFDAHLDLRQPAPRGHSGSPFYQIAADCEKNGQPFLYACIGARTDANPPELWERAQHLNVSVIKREDMGREAAALQGLKSYLNRSEAVYLSIDLDGFASPFAPGVSAASPWGFSPMEIMPYLECVLDSGKLIAVDLAELNPSYDRDGQTAALAAGLLHRILKHPGLF